MTTRPYRPSNGTAGEIFQEEFCYRCKREQDETNPCPILTATFVLSPDDPDYPPEWVEDADKPFGETNARCTAFEPI